MIEDNEDAELITELVSNARKQVNPQISLDDFYFTSAIEYPFKTEPFMSSRYSNGCFPVWYGSLSIETTIYETVYHTLRFLQATEGVMRTTEIVKKRSLFDVSCSALLINLQGFETSHPEIVSDDYSLTQKIGSTVRASGVAGIMSPSVRHKKGTNLNIFSQDTLAKPINVGTLTYRFLPTDNYVEVLGENLKMGLTF